MPSPQRKSPLSSGKLGGHKSRQQPYSTPDSRDVKARAHGQWIPILSALAPQVIQAIARPGRHVACPIHGGKDGFRLFTDANDSGGGICNTCGEFPDGFALLMWTNGWTFRESLEAVAGYLGIGPSTMLRKAAYNPSPVRIPDPDQAKQEAMERVWRESVPLNQPEADPARLYLRSRGLGLVPIDPTAVRFHPGLPYAADDAMASILPAIVARILSPSGALVGVHRTFVTTAGEKVDRRRMASPFPGASRGGAVRLFTETDRLMVGEGIETCFAAWLLMRGTWPVWSALDAGSLSRLELPSDVREVVIAADNDRLDKTGRRAGQHHAALLAARLRNEGRKATIAVPPLEGQDWADVLMTEKGQVVRHG